MLGILGKICRFCIVNLCALLLRARLSPFVCNRVLIDVPGKLVETKVFTLVSSQSNFASSKPG